MVPFSLDFRCVNSTVTAKLNKEDINMHIIPNEIKEYLSCDINTGMFIWIKSPSKRITIGKIAGTKTATCKNKPDEYYWGIQFKGTLYFAHRLVYWWFTDKQDFHIDHIDGNKLNNAFDNLRGATTSQNLCNRPKPSSNTTGYKGVHYNKATGKYTAQIRHQYTKHHLGYYATPEEAYLAYCEAAELYHKDFSNVN
jgi:hypothetical protein